MEQHHIAVISVLCLQTLKPVEVGVMEMANAFLRKADFAPMSSEEFKNVMSSVNNSTLSLENKKIEIKKKHSTMNNEQMFEALGDKVVVLFHSSILKKKKVNVEIRFNINGKIELMNKKHTTDNLSAISRKYANEYGIGKTGSTSDISKIAWKVSPDHHTELEGKRGVTLKKYIEKYC